MKTWSSVLKRNELSAQKHFWTFCMKYRNTFSPASCLTFSFFKGVEAFLSPFFRFLPSPARNTLSVTFVLKMHEFIIQIQSARRRGRKKKRIVEGVSGSRITWRQLACAQLM
jgi:hypothetical protein